MAPTEFGGDPVTVLKEEEDYGRGRELWAGSGVGVEKQFKRGKDGALQSWLTLQSSGFEDKELERALPF